MKKTLLALLAGSFAAASQAGALIDLAAEAGRPAANDMVRASVYSEASGSNPAGPVDLLPAPGGRVDLNLIGSGAPAAPANKDAPVTWPRWRAQGRSEATSRLITWELEWREDWCL